MSINLTSTTLVQVNGVTVENDTIGGCISMNIDYLANTASFTLKTGALASGNLAPGIYGPMVTITVNLITGVWTAFNSQSNLTTTGTIGGGALASFNAQLKSDRNLVESFAAGGSGIMPGTQVPWP